MGIRIWAGLGCLALLWGGSFLSVRVMLDEVPVATSVLHRTGWAALTLWLWVAMRGLAVPRDPRIWGALLGMGLLNNVIPFGLMTWAQLHVESGLTAILNAATAVFGVCLAALFFADEPLTPRRAAGVMLGFGGVATTIGLDSLGGLDPRALGQLAILLGALSYAFAAIWARLRLSGLAPAVAAAGMLSASTLVLLPGVLVLDGVPRLDLGLGTWGAIGYAAVVATALAYLLYYRLLALAGSGTLLLVTLMIPPVAIALGAAWRGEALPPTAFVGFGLLAAGLVLIDGRLLARLRRKA